MCEKLNKKMSNKLKNQVMSPINTVLLDVIGAYLVLTLTLCIIVNSLLIYVFARFKKLRTALNKLILVMTAFNLFGAIQFPFVIHSNFVHKYNFILLKYFCSYFSYLFSKVDMVNLWLYVCWLYCLFCWLHASLPDVSHIICSL